MLHGTLRVPPQITCTELVLLHRRMGHSPFRIRSSIIRRLFISYFIPINLQVATLMTSPATSQSAVRPDEFVATIFFAVAVVIFFVVLAAIVLCFVVAIVAAILLVVSGFIAVQVAARHIAAVNVGVRVKLVRSHRNLLFTPY